ncbi:hypothetical protein INS49_003775 [Diaporthe citri]|uniref:uncharacterized protein n=1 Tax=Diaporthe citri TaxID=83186 RepID=UPI001C80C064|nr:uncharacterized protein INS49_003775 [Diaporthe citri]KAG6355809.1 hypothetical protein INS49_003775 [Diaporthe citri]
MGGLKNILLALVPIVSLIAAVPTSDVGSQLNYVPKSYIIQFKEDVDVAAHAQWARSVHTRNLSRYRKRALPEGLDGVKTIFRQFRGYIGDFDDLTIEEIRAHPNVSYVEQDEVFEAFQIPSGSVSDVQSPVTQANATWGLSLISHRDLGATDYIYDASAGEGHYAYVLDSGINVDHVDFGGRASLGYNALNSQDHVDDTGHGTHVAGTIGSTTYGVAKKCNLVSVKISNATNWSFSALIDGMDWALNDMIVNNRTEKSVVNVSGGGPTSTAVNNAVLAAYRKGMTLVAAAGNGNRVSTWISPAGANGAIAVASVDRERRRAALSNYGPGISVFAPGEDTLSTWIGSDTATHVTNGTSMASPHVAGVVLYLQKLEGLSTPDAVRARLEELAIKDVVQDAQNSPNRLLYTGAA